MSDTNSPTPTTGAPDPAPASPAKTGPRIGWLTLVLALVATLAVGGFGGAAVASGVASSQSSTAPQGPRGPGSQGGPGNQGGPGTQGGPGARGGAGTPGGPGGFTAGEITGIDGTTITVKTQSGDTVTVTTNDDTTVTQSTKGSVSDLKKGDTIVVRGASSSGKVTATQITEGAFGGPAGN